MSIKHPICILIVSTLFLLSSCVKEEWVIDDNVIVPEFDPSFAFPIAQTSLNLGNLEQSLDQQSFIYSEADELFALVYSTEILQIDASDFLNLDAQQFEYAFAINSSQSDEINALSEGTSIIYPSEQDIVIDFGGGAEIDSVNLSEATLNFDIQSDINQDLIIDLTFPTLTQSGVAFQTTIELEYDNTLPIELESSIDLNGYNLDLTDGGTTNNLLPVFAVFHFTKTDQTTNPGDDIEMTIDIQANEFESVYGYIGQHNIDFVSDTQSIDAFEHLYGGTIGFADPLINLTIANTCGITGDFELNHIEAIESGASTQIMGTDLSDFPIIERADFPGDVGVTEHSIDNSGTSPTLSSLLEGSPDQIIYDGNIVSNPMGYDYNFVEEDNQITVNAEIVLPLYLYADNFTYVDTFGVDIHDFIMSNIGDDEMSEDDIEKVTLRMIAENGLPIDVSAQLIFADSSYNEIDSLFLTYEHQSILNSGLINYSVPITDEDYGKVYQSTRTTTDFILTSEDIKALRDLESKNIILRAQAMTSGAGDGNYVKFFPEYSLGIKMSAKIDLDIDLTE